MGDLNPVVSNASDAGNNYLQKLLGIAVMMRS